MTVVAIDGPAGAGKSTVARLVAAALNLPYLDTGAMYRAVALAALDAGLDINDRDAVTELAHRVSIRANDTGVHLDGQDVTDRIRDPDVTAAVSIVAANAGVRMAMLDQQRQAAIQGAVMEGRDIGSAVIPNAEVKIFLTASLEERARRRWQELGNGERVSLDNIKASIAQRDQRDAERASSPLIRAEDALEVDTTGRSIDDVVAIIVRRVQEVTGGH